MLPTAKRHRGFRREEVAALVAITVRASVTL
jgi:hypothetical protein